MHVFDVVEFGVAVPEKGAVGSEFVDAAVAEVDVGIVFELAGQFDDFGVEFDVEEGEGMVQGAPVGIGYLRSKTVMIFFAVFFGDRIVGDLFNGVQACLGESA